MLTEMLSRLARAGIWRAAGQTELPLLSREANALSNQLLVLAGGLALTLSRCAPEDHARHFPRAAFLYALLRKELAQHGRTSASATLILEAFHETTELLDPHSRQAFHKCLDARTQFDKMKAQERESGNTCDALHASFVPVSEDATSSAPHSSIKR